MSEHNLNHTCDGIAPAALRSSLGRERSARFRNMKKAFKILLLLAVVGIIGKIIIDNA